jgi:hypothetical protein
MTSAPHYEDPTVAYNTGYNDGGREERVAILKALEAFEIEVLMSERHLTPPMICGMLKRLCREMERGVHRHEEPGEDETETP